MGEGVADRGVEIVTFDGEVVGTVGHTLWHDATGFDIVAVERAGVDVVVPVRREQRHNDGVVSVDFPAADVRTAPSLDQLTKVGGRAAARIIARHYDVRLAGPPGSVIAVRPAETPSAEPDAGAEAG